MHLASSRAAFSLRSSRRPRSGSAYTHVRLLFQFRAESRSSPTAGERDAARCWPQGAGMRVCAFAKQSGPREQRKCISRLRELHFYCVLRGGRVADAHTRMSASYSNAFRVPSPAYFRAPNPGRNADIGALASCSTRSASANSTYTSSASTCSLSRFTSSSRSR